MLLFILFIYLFWGRPCRSNSALLLLGKCSTIELNPQSFCLFLKNKQKTLALRIFHVHWFNQPWVRNIFEQLCQPWTCIDTVSCPDSLNTTGKLFAERLHRMQRAKMIWRWFGEHRGRQATSTPLFIRNLHSSGSGIRGESWTQPFRDTEGQQHVISFSLLYFNA